MKNKFKQQNINQNDIGKFVIILFTESTGKTRYYLGFIRNLTTEEKYIGYIKICFNVVELESNETTYNIMLDKKHKIKFINIEE